MNIESNYYNPIDVESFRRKVIEKAGYSLKRNRSPVNTKSRRHSSTTSTEVPIEASIEGHYAVPDTRFRSSATSSGPRSPPGPPGPSSALRNPQENHADSRLISGDIRNGSRLPSGAMKNGRSSKNFSKHISFESLRSESPPPEPKQVTFQRTPDHYIGTENYFVGKRIAGKAVDSRTPMIKSYWEANIQREEKLKEEANNAAAKKTFGFPRWRSNDALSASLVASKGTNIEIPRDSKIPQHRLEKLEETERTAQQHKAMIHQSVEAPKKLQKGKSLDSLMMQLDYQPWYDRNQIREGISRESIANLGATKDKFENSTQPKGNRRSDPTVSPTRFDSPVQQMQIKVEPRYVMDPYKEMNGSSATEKEDKRERQYFDNAYGIKDSSHMKQTMTPKSSQPEVQVIQQQKIAEERTVNLTSEQEIFLLFIKQNVDLVGGLGIVIPDGLKNIMNELPWRKVELRSTYEEESRRPTAEIKSYQPQAYNKEFQAHSPNSPGQGSLQNGQSLSNKSGRYVKNPAAVNGNGNHRIISRKTFDLTTKQIPENRRPIMQDVDRERAGDSLIAAEIRMLRDREEELRRSRSELGLPSLEDTIEIWRNGYNNTRQMNPLRSAVSYDHLHQAPQQMSKTASIEHLHHIANEAPRNFYEKEAKTAQNERQLQQNDRPMQQNDRQFQSNDRQFQQNERQFQQNERQFQPNETCERTSRQQSHQAHRKSGLECPIQSGEEIVVNRDYIGQRNSQQFPTSYSHNHYKLHKSDDPDVMIYGPSTRRQSSCADSTLHLAGSPVTNGPGMRTVRYE